MTFDLPLNALVIMNLFWTFALWRVAVKKPERLKKKFLTELLRLDPIAPKHQPPKAMVGSMVKDEDRRFFDDFREFADIMNGWWGNGYYGGRSPWRLQELPETMLQLQYSDTPRYGRRYSIFHNQVSLGTLEIWPYVRYSAETPDVIADIELDWVRLLPFGRIRMFLDDIAAHVCGDAGSPPPRTRTLTDINGSLTEVLWDTLQIQEIDPGQDYGKLELQLQGSAPVYRDRRRSLRNQRAALRANDGETSESLKFSRSSANRVGKMGRILAS